MSMHRCTVTGPKPTWLRPLLPSQLGRPWAAGLLTALVVLSPALEPAVMLGVESWVSSRAAGPTPGAARCVPDSGHCGTVRPRHQHT